ncbi:hypothetical protein [Maribacter sp. 2-571]
MCKNCSEFTKKNTELTSLCDKAQLNGLSNNDKEQMKAAIKEKS